jgi:hypothetical protein
MEKRAVLTKKEQEELRRKKRSNRILERSNKTNSILSQRLEISDSPTDGIMGTPVLSSPREKHILNLKEDESTDYLNVDLKLETEVEEKEQKKEKQEDEKENTPKKQEQEDEGEKSYKGILWESNEEKVPLIIEEEEKKKISEKEEISPVAPLKKNSILNLNFLKLLTLFLISFLLSFDFLKQEYKSPFILFFLNEFTFLTFHVMVDQGNIFKNQFAILFFIFKFLFEFFVDFSFFIIFYTTLMEIKKFNF